ncbi:bZIP transcription factor [Histoplasma capsulatum H143]|uniref:BZIP transcription factor n=1 Tax=Ajellomyces capsulatus (strain H143) TaxID=544712 RepID=C6HLH3_AJECH|nr:bZIP transcription factor [Histoplasma capsulatum H143]
MTRYQPSSTFEFYHQSPSTLDAKPVFSADDEMSVLDDKILESSTSDIPSMNDPRRSSFDHTPEDFSRRNSVWSESQSRHASQMSTPLFESVNPFVRVDTAPSASYGQPQSWPLSADSGSCTPTPIYEQFPHDYDGNSSNPFAGGAVGPVNPTSFSHIPYRPGSTFPGSTATPMSPQSSQGWVSGTSEATEARAKPVRNTPYRNGSPLHLRRDGIRKKNARFDIPAERTLSNIDMLISQCTDEDEIKELKQQKRLLRNRQAALDSRQRKKVHTEQLEEDKKRSSSLINELEEALREMKLREAEYHREKAELFEREQHLRGYIDQLHIEKEEMIRSHTLETGELRKKNAILREHLEKVELNAQPASNSTFRNDFSDYENITMENAPWDDFSMVNEFSLGTENHGLISTPTPVSDNSILVNSKKAEKSSDKPPGHTDSSPFSWNTFYMCLLFGAFIASNSSTVSPAIPPLSEEYRVESANVLRAVLASADSTDAANSLNPGAIPGPSLTTLEDDGGDFKPPPSNFQQAYANMRNTGMQHTKKVPEKVVRDFRRMVKKCSASTSVKDEQIGAASTDLSYDDFEHPTPLDATSNNSIYNDRIPLRPRKHQHATANPQEDLVLLFLPFPTALDQQFYLLCELFLAFRYLYTLYTLVVLCPMVLARTYKRSPPILSNLIAAKPQGWTLLQLGLRGLAILGRLFLNSVLRVAQI